jgi:hypothetical protein
MAMLSHSIVAKDVNAVSVEAVAVDAATDADATGFRP